MLFKKVVIAASIFASMLIFNDAATAQTSDVERPGAGRVRLQNQDFGYFFSDTQWPKEGDGKTIIYVCWERNLLENFPNETAWVKSAIRDSWQKHSRIEFRGWQTCAEHNSGIHIVVLDSGPRVKFFGKNLDKKPGGMELNFKFESWSPSCKATEAARELCIKSIAVHEFGHAIGFAHEQDRSDTPGECASREGTGTTGRDLKMLTPYDPDSVMNYCNTTYNNDGKLSPRDIESVQQKYGVPRT